jgi:adenylate kinase
LGLVRRPEAQKGAETVSSRSQPLYIVLLGPPGAGKGTQAQLLSEAFGIPHVSSGDLFRDNLQQETELGLLAKSYMERGELVPDDVTVKMVIDRLHREDCEAGALLDGFPRTLEQAAALDEALAMQGHHLSAALLIDVSDEEVVARLSGRRVCRDCGAVYHTRYNPPSKPGVCDQCGGPLYQRADDRPETVRNRLLVYYRQTSPLVGYYFAPRPGALRKGGILKRVDGEQDIEAVQAHLVAAVSADDHP